VQNSSASWSATRTATRLCYVRGPEGIIIELAEQIAQRVESVAGSHSFFAWERFTRGSGPVARPARGARGGRSAEANSEFTDHIVVELTP
jgi:hypothetical protein